MKNEINGNEWGDYFICIGMDLTFNYLIKLNGFL